MLSLQLITAPAVEPVTIAEAKMHGKIEYTNEDALIAIFIKACRERAEEITNRALITQVWEQRADWDDMVDYSFTNRAMQLRKGPIQSVASIKYLDQYNAVQTWDTANYTVDIGAEPARIAPVYGQYWPWLYYAINALTVRFTAGYGTDGTNVPAQIKLWMLQRMTTYDQFREQIIEGRFGEIPRDYADGMLDTCRLYL